MKMKLLLAIWFLLPSFMFGGITEKYADSFAINLFFDENSRCQDILDKWEKETDFLYSIKDPLQKIIDFSEENNSFIYAFFFPLLRSLDPKSKEFEIISLVKKEYEAIRDHFFKQFYAVPTIFDKEFYDNPDIFDEEFY